MSKPENGLLQCTECLKEYKNPCTLDCFHSFCRKCVVSFTKQQPDAVSVRSLCCPFCHHLTPVPDPDRPVEEWPTQMRSSLVLQDLLEPDREESTDEIPCDLCKEDGETVDATARCSVCEVTLCDGCLKAHRRNPASRHHDIAGVLEDVKVKQKGKLTCSVHGDEPIQFYCKDCKESLCQLCCELCHKNCNNITSLDALLPEIKISLQDSKDVLTQVTGKQKTKIGELKSKFDELESLRLSHQMQISSTCEKIVEAIKTKESKLLQELEGITSKTLGKMKTDIKQAEMARQISQQKSNLIDYVLQSNNDIYMYETYLSCEAGVVQLVDDLVTDSEEAETLSDIKLVQDTDKLYNTIEELHLGEFEATYESGLGELKMSAMSQEIESLRVVGDESQASPTDVISLVVNGENVVVVTDWGSNKSVKSFYTKGDRSCHSRLELNGGPYSLTRFSHNEVAVTVPDCKQTVIIEVTPDLKLQSTITTRKEYWGITALTPSTLAVGCQSPPCVDIIDMTGTVLRTLRPYSKGSLVVKYPNFLCATKKGNILVSDCGTKSIMCLTSSGDVVFNYIPTGEQALKSPRGITTTHNEDILVADFSLHNIVHLTQSGSFAETSLTAKDSLQYPHGLFADEHDNVYISIYSEGAVKISKCTTK